MSVLALKDVAKKSGDPTISSTLPSLDKHLFFIISTAVLPSGTRVGECNGKKVDFHQIVHKLIVCGDGKKALRE